MQQHVLEAVSSKEFEACCSKLFAYSLRPASQTFSIVFAEAACSNYLHAMFAQTVCTNCLHLCVRSKCFRTAQIVCANYLAWFKKLDIRRIVSKRSSNFFSKRSSNFLRKHLCTPQMLCTSANNLRKHCQTLCTKLFALVQTICANTAKLFALKLFALVQTICANTAKLFALVQTILRKHLNSLH